MELDNLEPICEPVAARPLKAQTICLDGVVIEARSKDNY